MSDDTGVTGGEQTTGTDPADVATTETTETNDEGKTYSKAEVDKIVEKRLIRERKSATEAAEKARIAALTDTERIIEEAKAEARAEVLSANATKLAAAEIKVALTGLVDNPEDVIEDLNLSKYVDEDYSVDAEAVKKLRTKYETLLGGAQKRKAAAPGFQPGRTNNTKSRTPQEDFAESMGQLFGNAN